MSNNELNSKINWYIVIYSIKADLFLGLKLRLCICLNQVSCTINNGREVIPSYGRRRRRRSAENETTETPLTTNDGIDSIPQPTEGSINEYDYYDYEYQQEHQFNERPAILPPGVDTSDPNSLQHIHGIFEVRYCK